MRPTSPLVQFDGAPQFALDRGGQFNLSHPRRIFGVHGCAGVDLVGELR
jgi:hypothetical protein